MRKAFFIFFLFVSGVLMAQNGKEITNEEMQFKQVYSAINLSKKTNSIEHVDELIASKQITNPDLISELYLYKASFIERKDCKIGSLITESKVKEVLKCYDTVISMSQCVKKIWVELDRFDALGRLSYKSEGGLGDNIDALRIISLESLKQRGYKPPKEGLGLGLRYTMGAENWVGIDFSLFSFLQHNYKIETGCNYRKYYYESFLSADGLKFSYSHSLTTNKNDISLSLIDINAPVVFIPARFGYQFGSSLPKTSFYYRPGIGLSIWFLSLSYSYNVVFSDDYRSQYEKHLFSMSFNYPIVSGKNREKK